MRSGVQVHKNVDHNEQQPTYTYWHSHFIHFEVTDFELTILVSPDVTLNKHTKSKMKICVILLLRTTRCRQLSCTYHDSERLDVLTNSLVFHLIDVAHGLISGQIKTQTPTLRRRLDDVWVIAIEGIMWDWRLFICFKVFLWHLLHFIWGQFILLSINISHL